MGTPHIAQQIMNESCEHLSVVTVKIEVSATHIKPDLSLILLLHLQSTSVTDLHQS